MVLINGCTTAVAVLHLVTLARWQPKWRPPFVHGQTVLSHVTSDSHVGNRGSSAFTANCSGINYFTTAFAVFNLVTLTIKDGSLHGSNHPVQSRGN